MVLGHGLALLSKNFPYSHTIVVFWKFLSQYHIQQILILGTSKDKSKKGYLGKGPSINDVSPKGEGGGYKKRPKRRRLLVDLRRQGEGGYPKNLKFGETSFMDGP